MVVEQELLPFLTWLTGYPWTTDGALANSALVIFLGTALAFFLLALLVGFLVAVVRHGRMPAGDITYRVVVNGVTELLHTSPRRVWAMAGAAAPSRVSPSWVR